MLTRCVHAFVFVCSQPPVAELNWQPKAVPQPDCCVLWRHTTLDLKRDLDCSVTDQLMLIINTERLSENLLKRPNNNCFPNVTKFKNFGTTVTCKLIRDETLKRMKSGNWWAYRSTARNLLACYPVCRAPHSLVHYQLNCAVRLKKHSVIQHPFVLFQLINQCSELQSGRFGRLRRKCNFIKEMNSWGFERQRELRIRSVWSNSEIRVCFLTHVRVDCDV
jgi:hypothetical protein